MDDASRVGELCSGCGADVREAKDEAERSALWDSRRAISPALHRLNMKKINEDIVVPRSRLAEMFTILERISEKSGIRIVSFGHAGDGNIHINIMAPKTPEGLSRGQELVGEIFREVLSLGGTISGEHGVGLTKAPYIGMEIGQRELSLMREIKRVFDPHNILNPGKVFG
jgi:glycolate oxidase